MKTHVLKDSGLCLVQDDHKLLGDSGEVPIYECCG